jgi:hypothetical protein
VILQQWQKLAGNYPDKNQTEEFSKRRIKSVNDATNSHNYVIIIETKSYIFIGNLIQTNKTYKYRKQ